MLSRLQRPQGVDSAKLVAVQGHVPVHLPQHDLVNKFRREFPVSEIIQPLGQFTLVAIPLQELSEGHHRNRWLGAALSDSFP